MDAALVRRTSASGAVEENRRLYPRRRLTFPATFTVDGEPTLPAFGLDLSGGGVRLFTRDPIRTSAKRALSLTAVVEGRKVQLRAIRRWSSAFEAPAGMRYRHGLQLKGIADGDWEFLMNLTLDSGIDGSGAHRGVLTPGQLNRLLTLDKQHHVAEALAQAGRLEYNPGHRLPLIEYAFDGYTMRSGVPYYRFTIRSKAARPTGVQEYRTSVLVGIESDIVKIVDSV